MAETGPVEDKRVSHRSFDILILRDQADVAIAEREKERTNE